MMKFFDSKKKVGAAVICGALVMSIGTGAAFAASKYSPLSNLDENGTVSHSSGEDGTPGIKIRMKDENGKVNETTGDQFHAKLKSGLMIARNIDGKLKFSTDGGKTWSETAPDGVTVNEDGSISGSYDGIPVPPAPSSPPEYNSVQKSALNIIDENGKVNETTGDQFQTKLKSGLMIARNIDGKLKFSTDGGKTWSETAPDGVTVNEDGSISGSYDGIPVPPAPPAVPPLRKSEPSQGN
ncbi:hypothetical protein MUG84_26980 [Paenibacillus sp. KQZ6P-2]|uniref:Uncharacterized protein n=1 Tax=Paenibacillus mangrovi TaxID=2931978 RepID=A0A9X2B5S0_9BACL|nr:hypothetical protein [Paenibacillus mangrovi]MCJ8015315.1 hypothetical protein [Paenibacillus mangrovi]